MAKGQIAKTEITKKILEVFDGAFINEKEIRIPWIENGDVVQIKVALTCAKTNIDAGEQAPMQQSTSVPAENRKITAEEKQEMDILIEKLGL